MTKEEKERLKKFEKTIDIKFTNQELLKRSLIHRSYLNEISANGLRNNERLEYLGDAVLELIVSKYLFDEYPDRTEGELTSFRAALVRTESLADTAMELKFGEFIYMSRGEEATGGRSRPYIMANTFEAVIGAIFLDQGIDASRKFILEKLVPKITKIVKNRLDIDPKSKLQEVAQEKLKDTPTYVLKDAAGPDHEKEFTISVNILEKELGTGKGKSKQEAETDAARATLKDWKKYLKKYT